MLSKSDTAIMCPALILKGKNNKVKRMNKKFKKTINIKYKKKETGKKKSKETKMKWIDA